MPSLTPQPHSLPVVIGRPQSSNSTHRVATAAVVYNARVRIAFRLSYFGGTNEVLILSSQKSLKVGGGADLRANSLIHLYMMGKATPCD